MNLYQDIIQRWNNSDAHGLLSCFFIKILLMLKFSVSVCQKLCSTRNMEIEVYWFLIGWLLSLKLSDVSSSTLNLKTFIQQNKRCHNNQWKSKVSDLILFILLKKNCNRCNVLCVSFSHWFIRGCGHTVLWNLVDWQRPICHLQVFVGCLVLSFLVSRSEVFSLGL